MKEMTKLECRIPKEDRKAFTLMELLVVIAIIAVLLGLAFPVFQGVLDRAKKVQAKNDVTQIDRGERVLHRIWEISDGHS